MKEVVQLAEVPAELVCGCCGQRWSVRVLVDGRRVEHLRDEGILIAMLDPGHGEVVSCAACAHLRFTVPDGGDGADNPISFRR